MLRHPLKAAARVNEAHSERGNMFSMLWMVTQTLPPFDMAAFGLFTSTMGSQRRATLLSAIALLHLAHLASGQGSGALPSTLRPLPVG